MKTNHARSFKSRNDRRGYKMLNTQLLKQEDREKRRAAERMFSRRVLTECPDIYSGDTKIAAVYLEPELPVGKSGFSDPWNWD